MIVMDLEWNSGVGDGKSLAEILQIGAVKYDRSAHKIVDTFSVFIHPCVHSEFSVGAKALPQLWRSLESRLTFEQAYTAFLDWVGEETMFAAWGGGDWHVLNDNAKYYSLPIKQDVQMLDVQSAFSLTMGVGSVLALYKAVEFCHIPDCFDYHDALADAMYTALVSEWVDEGTLELSRGKTVPRSMEMTGKTFETPPAKYSEYFTNRHDVINCDDMRIVNCPICGAKHSIGEWFSNDRRRYYAAFRCHGHGRFICRMTIVKKDDLIRGRLAIPQMTPKELHSFQVAKNAKHYLCSATLGLIAQKRKNKRKKQTAQADATPAQ